MIQIQLEKAPPVADGPIEHLMACHRRIEERLATLERAGASLDTLPEQSLAAVQNCIRFMDLSGALHTVDEEESLFPRLRMSLTAGETAYLDQLEAEHREADAAYLQLKEVVADLRQQVTPARVADYRALVAKLNGMYRKHITSEDTLLVEMGRRELTPDDLETIQAEMRARRR